MERDDGFLLDPVIAGGYCVGCGACAVGNAAREIKENKFGLYEANIIASSAGGDGAISVCPFLSESNEDSIGARLYGDSSDVSFDRRVGFYRSVYAGHVSEKSYRENGSSGGLVTWVLSRLLTEGEIDGVIHVGETGQNGNLFEYRISSSVDELTKNAKSRYYPVHMDRVLEEALSSGKRFAFVGVPCFVKSVRLLAERNEDVARCIKFCIAIFCGHFKTKAFAEMVGWQQNVHPSELVGIDFRVKDKSLSADNYSVSVVGSKGTIKKPVRTRLLYGMDWGLGYFKPKACDWCDDISGETADLACGDAWLPEFIHHSMGTNIVVVRNAAIAALISEGMTTGALSLQAQAVDKVYQSQAGNYRHRQEGLSVRVSEADAAGVWHPKKRIEANTFSVSEKRRHIYALREKIAAHSHIAFYRAKKKNSFFIFYLGMLSLELRYYYSDNRLAKGFLKSSYHIFMHFKRKLFG